MQITMIGDIEISSNGQSVWVNGPLTCLARFGERGWWDVGCDKPDFEGAPWNEPGLRPDERWPIFVSRVKSRYGIAVPDSHKPKSLEA